MRPNWWERPVGGQDGTGRSCELEESGERSDLQGVRPDDVRQDLRRPCSGVDLYQPGV